MEFKEVADYLGFKADDMKTIEDFKVSFDKEFLRTSSINEDSDPVKKIVGKLFGTLENEIKKVAKASDLEVDFDSEDLKGKKVTEKLKFVFSKYDEKNKTTFEDLKKQAGQGNDDKVKEWENKYEKLNKKFADVDGLLKKTSEDFEGYKQNSVKEVKNVKLGIHKAEIFGKAKFAPEVNEYAKKGFINEFEEKYSLDLDENEKPIIIDKKGQRIPNPRVTGSFYDPADLFLEETIKAKLFQLNKDGGKPAPNFQQQSSTPVTSVTSERKVASRMT